MILSAVARGGNQRQKRNLATTAPEAHAPQLPFSPSLFSLGLFSAAATEITRISSPTQLSQFLSSPPTPANQWCQYVVHTAAIAVAPNESITHGQDDDFTNIHRKKKQQINPLPPPLPIPASDQQRSSFYAQYTPRSMADKTTGPPTASNAAQETSHRGCVTLPAHTPAFSLGDIS